MKSTQISLIILALILSTCSTTPKAQSEDSPILVEDLVFSAGDFIVEENSGLTLLPDGLSLAPDAYRSVYQSPTFEAPIPFNAVVPQWIANIPANANLALFMRMGENEEALGDWLEIHPSLDWTLTEDEDIVGDMQIVPSKIGKNNFVQYMVTIGRNDKLTEPILQELKFTFIDSTAGPTVEEMLIQQQILDENTGTGQADSNLLTGGVPKPVVISRDVWCKDPQCEYDEGLEYHPVTHLILHHTVSGSGSDSAAVVRAIWSFHANTRGWGDIGYNFLVDTQGVLFEGHNGGDDVIGTHASGANAGSMALAVIGDYRTVTPPTPMVASIVDLFSWKADQRHINVFDSSNALPNIEWGLPHVMGHRDVYGTTECPGDQAHDLVPMIRDQVAERIGLESPHIYVDELSSAFIKSNANWYEPIYQCGHNTHSWYTWSTTNSAEAANWGEWRPAVPESGQYQIEVHVPYCNTGRSESTGAVYEINHAQGKTTKTINQQTGVGLWNSLGSYSLTVGTENVIRLSDLTTTEDGRGIWFDAIRLLPLKRTPSATNILPENETWQVQKDVFFQWEIDEPDLVSSTLLEVATDDAFQNIVASEEWASAIREFTIPFSQDYPKLFWRIILKDIDGESFTSTASRFGIDTQPPASAVLTPTWLPWEGRYLISWTGEDQLNPILSFNIETRQKGVEMAEWEPWLVGTTALDSTFIPENIGQIYEFRSQAIDAVGNVEASHIIADTDTGQAFVLSHAIMMPAIFN